MKLLYVATAGLAGILLLITAACGHSQSVTVSDGKVTVTGNGGDATTITVGGKDGKTASVDFNQDKIPGDYPKDVPVYTPSTVKMSQTVSESGARNLMLESPDDMGKIAGFYKGAMEKAGWKNESSINTGALNILVYSKDQKTATIQISDSGGKRSIMQVLADKQ